MTEYREEVTVFGTLEIRSRIGTLATRLGSRSPVARTLREILEDYDATKDEHAALFELEPIARKAEGHRNGRVKSAAISLSNGLEGVRAHPLYEG